MPMYDLVFGSGESGYPWLLALGFEDTGQLGRYRDAWAELGEDGAPRIAVYTRNGGGNRREYVGVIASLRAHPLYLSDRDDYLDETYATFYFRWPDGLVERARQEGVDLTKLGGPVDTSARWKEAFERMNVEGPTEEQREALRPLLESIQKGEGGVFQV